MPSSLHEAIVELFRSRPVLAAEVLGRYLHVDVPGFKEARLVSGDLPKLKPAERRADTVVILRDERSQSVLSVAVEIQLSEDKGKRRSWPDYLTGLFSRHSCAAILLVVCQAGELRHGPLSRSP